MIDRRSLLRATGAVLTSGALRTTGSAAIAQELVELPFENGARPLVSYPGKRPLLRVTARPPQLETPFSVFDEDVITPNDAFFVRYHLADIPLSIDPESFRIAVTGSVKQPLSLSLKELKEAFQPTEMIAVAECSGNSRGFFHPRVAGGQLGHGAMGNARWRGVPLKAILDKAGVQAGARQVVFDGLDRAVMAETPDFLKALDIDHARDGEVMVAYEMNGEELPWLNGYPARLVAPGFYATYWVKHLCEIRVVDTVYDGFWMKSGYRIPDNPCACTEPGASAGATVPIGRLNVRSFITNLAEGAKIKANADLLIKGIAFDGGYGVSTVLFSSNGGKTWTETALGTDHGRYSFREWRIETRLSEGEHVLAVCAINRIGQSQPLTALWSPSGYMRNTVENIRVISQ